MDGTFWRTFDTFQWSRIILLAREYRANRGVSCEPKILTREKRGSQDYIS